MCSSEPTNRGDGKLIETATRMLQLRDLRNELFPAAIFNDIGWEILLLLYSNALQGRLSVATLAEAAHAPITTTARWVDYLCTMGMLSCEPVIACHQLSVELSDKGRSCLNIFLARLLTTCEQINKQD